jgi:hypothetical protein
MSKYLLFLSIVLFCDAGASAQAYVGQIDYRHTNQATATIRLPYSASSVEDGLKEYMMTKGFKKSSVSGFMVFRSVPLDPTDTVLNDLYFTTDPASRKEKDMTLLNLLPAKKNQDIAARNLSDSGRLDKAQVFLDSVAPFIDAYNTRLQINSGQEGLKKAQKKMNDLVNDQADLEKRLRKLQADLDQNKSDQAKAVGDLQSNINADQDTKKSSQKKVTKLIDEQGSLEKKIRKTQLDLDENKTSQGQQQTEINKQQQGLDAVKARQNR